ncbi:LANO_0F06128g1_1 [Lachancea nothofagi CBS 11611]|uniref:Serine hydroxymethyltransferase, mitochondrial n=1 Tax=Lachancea nothofagi CBS 11611 TaxID=1266666 RepID=A0A1G4K8C7_9SACH|nr:LANO_0F06128g1_1 [Lachancea nothofagi CBS 11611]
MLSRMAARQFKSLALCQRLYATAGASANQVMVSKHVQEVDPEMHDILTKERHRQKHSVTLIPSENFTSKSVMDLLGSEMQNKYSEGYPGERYYGGNQFIDQAESLCQKRALELYGLDPEKWGVNVQALSGAPANLYTYSAVMDVNDRLMGLDLPHGGHLSHGYQLASGTKISYVSKYFQTMPYHVDVQTGLIDYDTLAQTSKLFRPKVIVAGTSAYSRLLDYKRFKEISDACGAYLMSDMAHISGLVAAGVIPSPFDYSDLVTTTTHKSLRGPRGSMIFYRKGVRKVTKKGKEVMYDLDKRINFSVFPGHQGGPHNHTISALAVALKQAATPEFKLYQESVVDNARVFSEELKKRGFELVSGGSDTHLVLIDLSNIGIDGARLETVLEKINIAANKNTVPGDKSALFPSGLRLGTPAMTTRGFGREEFVRVAEYIDKASKIAIGLKSHEPADAKDVRSKLANFRQLCEESREVASLAEEVSQWAGSFPVPGEL